MKRFRPETERCIKVIWVLLIDNYVENAVDNDDDHHGDSLRIGGTQPLFGIHQPFVHPCLPLVSWCSLSLSLSLSVVQMCARTHTDTHAHTRTDARFLPPSPFPTKKHTLRQRWWWLMRRLSGQKQQQQKSKQKTPTFALGYSAYGTSDIPARCRPTIRMLSRVLYRVTGRVDICTLVLKILSIVCQYMHEHFICLTNRRPDSLRLQRRTRRFFSTTEGIVVLAMLAAIVLLLLLMIPVLYVTLRKCGVIKV